MGVVHKLKEEIVDFIISQKRTVPSLSCRELAVLVSDSFRIKVAKSSVNKILKQSQLSSAVGRRSLSAAARKFQIPPIKKKELSEKFESKRVIYKGMGSIFLKIAEWELGQSAFWTTLVKKNVPGIEDALGPQKTSDNLENLCGAMVLLKILGQSAGEETKEDPKHALWIFNRTKDPLEAQKLKKLTQTEPISPCVYLEYFNAKEQLFHEVKGFKIFLEDGNSFVFDAALGALAPGEAGLSFCRPVNKAMELLSRRLISNKESVILNKIPTEDGLFKDFCEMTACFERLPGKNIKTIQVLDRQGQGLIDFSIIPLKRRAFMAGLSPDRKEFAGLARSVQWSSKTPYYCEWADKIFYFSEGEAKFPREPAQALNAFRIVMIWEEGSEDPVLAIVTNNKEISARDLIADYFLRWPDWKNSDENIAADTADSRAEQSLSGGPLGFLPRAWEEIFYDFGNSLHAFCQKNFFPFGYQSLNIEMVIERLYGLAGYFTETKNVLGITLLIPESYPYKQDAFYAVDAVNQRGVEDENGVKIRMEIKEVS